MTKEDSAPASAAPESVASASASRVPELAPAGDGIPAADKFFVRHFILPFAGRRKAWGRDNERFRKATLHIFEAIDGLTEEELSKRILIAPLKGLEDSSRYWSVAMTLEHLVIVAHGIAALMIALGQGKQPRGTVDTAAVKPQAAEDPFAAVAAFREMSDVILDTLDEDVENKDSRLTHDHPWFGPMSLRQWHWLLATHQELHLRQIRAIVKKLPLR